MSKLESIGLTGIESFQYFVHDLDRSHRFYVDHLDFAEVGAGQGADTSRVFHAGDITVQCTAPSGEGEAQAYLAKHPDGIGRITFQVKDVEKTFRLIEERGGTPIDTVQRQGQNYAWFDITTPFGPTVFRFAQRGPGYTGFGPGVETFASPKGGRNKHGFKGIDHVTSNFLTMSPALLWMKHVMGLTQFWDVQFHTTDVSESTDKGSGLRSVVMTDPESGIKFANNEPWRPFFKQSQIYVFCDDLRGDGVQHLALTVDDIIPTVRSLRGQGVGFMHTPGTYYDVLPQRIKDMGIGSIDEDVEVLRDLGILVDGEKAKSYLLQIFLKESAGLYGEKEAGPFFYEIIQRKGDEGFGAGNFRALFESIEREQQTEGRV
ncbi:MAG: VOC family protein [Myxococcota bacterium]